MKLIEDLYDWNNWQRHELVIIKKKKDQRKRWFYHQGKWSGKEKLSSLQYGSVEAGVCIYKRQNVNTM